MYLKTSPMNDTVAAILRRIGLASIPLGSTLYVLPERKDDYRLIAHGRAHLAQMRRMGALRFYLTYIYQWARYGVFDMPLEREARGE